MPSFDRPYLSLPAGHVLWHVFNPRYGSTSFNFASRNRYAAHQATPSRGMFYAGDTSSCVLWETVLRDVAPDATSPHDVDPPPLGDLRIARMTLRRDVQLLPLYTPHLRWIDAGNLNWRLELQQSTIVPDYAITYGIAVRLLQRFPGAEGLRWHSRQASSELAAVFYEPPVGPHAFTPEEDWALDSSEGVRLIDVALAQASMRRLDAAALAAELRAELPPKDREE